MKVVLELNDRIVTNIVADGELDLYVIDHQTELGDDQVLISQYQVPAPDPVDVEYLDQVAALWEDGQDIALRSN